MQLHKHPSPNIDPKGAPYKGASMPFRLRSPDDDNLSLAFADLILS